MSKDWQLNHVGLMVTNKNTVLKRLQSLGIGVSVGPQPLLPHEAGQGSLTFYRKLDGDPVTSTYPTGGAHNFNDGESQIGDCQLECIEMKPGPGMFINEYLALKGPGINHICFNVPDVEGETQKLLDRGCALMFNATVNGKTVENYLDTRQHGDVMISFRPPASDWERAWKANNMAHPLVNNWSFLGVGIGVSSLDDAVRYYERLGFTEVGSETDDFHLGLRSRRMQVGPLAFEFVQPTSTTSVYQDSLVTRGDGINDIAFLVDDLEHEVSRLTEKGAPVLVRHDSSESGATAYFETRQEGNLMLRLIQR
ncbi:MAG: VOC family protein [Proteobacteria bacterium]|jgi:catechol 2,3-dioxygenase-like lactoylglutathione lyase family enzyme|nr:VOC family protein [Pseudomonadota bacterium]MDA1300281.1 VOC family protein [Pseudomonadota bacterium]